MEYSITHTHTHTLRRGRRPFLGHEAAGSVLVFVSVCVDIVLVSFSLSVSHTRAFFWGGRGRMGVLRNNLTAYTIYNS